MRASTRRGFGRRTLLGLLLLLVALTALITVWATPPGEAEAQGPNTGESVQLYRGGNLVSYLGATLSVPVALNDASIYVEAIWYFEALDQAWLLWSPALPEALQSFQELRQYQAYFLFLSQDTEWSFLFVDPRAARTCAEQAGAVPAGLAAQQGGAVEVFFLIEPVELVGGEPLVCSVERAVAGADPPIDAVQALLAGPTQDEQAIGVGSRWDGVLSGESDCDGADFTLTVSGGLATIQFCRTVILTGVISDAVMSAQLRATLTQFPTTDQVAVLDEFGGCLFDLSGLNLCLAHTPATGPDCVSDLRAQPLSDLGPDTEEFFTWDDVVYGIFEDLDGDGVRERISQIFFLQNRQLAFYLSGAGCTTYAGTMLGVYADPLPTSTNGVRDLMTDATCGLAGLCRTFTTWRYDGSRYQPGDVIECLGEESDPVSCPIHELVE